MWLLTNLLGGSQLTLKFGSLCPGVMEQTVSINRAVTSVYSAAVGQRGGNSVIKCEKEWILQEEVVGKMRNKQNSQ